ncbi:hypothetical protein C8R46DRAFT_1104614 [Mycena filopes]|nr:hypothetical protein C8R46DRAFT_1104614 [Mycena filopes]
MCGMQGGRVSTAAAVPTWGAHPWRGERESSYVPGANAGLEGIQNTNASPARSLSGAKASRSRAPDAVRRPAARGRARSPRSTPVSTHSAPHPQSSILNVLTGQRVDVQPSGYAPPHTEEDYLPTSGPKPRRFWVGTRRARLHLFNFKFELRKSNVFERCETGGKHHHTAGCVLNLRFGVITRIPLSPFLSPTALIIFPTTFLPTNRPTNAPVIPTLLQHRPRHHLSQPQPRRRRQRGRGWGIVGLFNLRCL